MLLHTEPGPNRGMRTRRQETFKHGVVALTRRNTPKRIMTKTAPATTMPHTHTHIELHTHIYETSVSNLQGAGEKGQQETEEARGVAKRKEQRSIL